MLGSQEMVALVRDTHDVMTLSVYIDGRVIDPAQRTRWRTELQHALDAARAGVPTLEREAFLIAETRLEQVLAKYDGAIGAPGYVAFITPDRVRYAEAVPTPMPHMVFWSRGARVAPYVRALEHERPVFAVVAGSREARFYKWQGGTLARLDSVTPRGGIDDKQLPDRARTATSASGVRTTGASAHRNVRGATGADEAERRHETAVQRLIADVVDTLAKDAGGKAWVVLGGAKDIVPRMLSALPGELADRTLVHPSLRSKATLAQIRDAVQEGAAQLRLAREQAMVSRLVEQAHARARAAMGMVAAREAIDRGAVEELVVTPNAWRRDPGAVEAVVSDTLLQGGTVEELAGDAADRLDAAGGGIGALLRFPTTGASTAAAPKPTA